MLIYDEIQDTIDIASEKLSEEMQKYDLPSRIEEAEDSEW